MSQATKRVLSIQSHVSFGYVGGKAAVFPLQCLGYDVDVVNTVNFSNHSGYGRFGGPKANVAELESIFQGMETNELLKPHRLLTGYIPGAEGLQAVANLATKLKEENPKLVYLLDPVLGDAGKLYVAPDVIPVYKSMLPLASVITPNWFEVETLTDVKLTSMDSLQTALRILHLEFHVPNVVISSIPLNSWLLDALPSKIAPPIRADLESQQLLCVSSSATSAGKEVSVVHAQHVELIPGYFSGVGDLFSALLLAHFNPTSLDAVSTAASHALTKTHAILQLTHDYSMSLPEEERLPSDEEKDLADPLRKTRRMRGRELRLVQGQDILRGSGQESRSLRPLEEWTDFWSR